MDGRPLTREEKQELLKLARLALSVRLGLAPQDRLDDLPRPPALKNVRGAFVTLTRRGRLRGCIGTFEPETSLAEVVQEMAVSAGFRDPRFPPVSAADMETLEIEISALTVRREVTDISHIEVGVHGIHITRGGNRGVLLPQVAVEWGWNREEFLENTCLKAGLPPQAWNQGAKIEVFSAEVFSESDLGGSKVSCSS